MSKFPYAPLRSGKVAIVGFANETMGFAPFEDEECEIWVLNMLHSHVPRWDRLWELHDRATIEQETEELKRNTDHLGVLKAETTRPIYMVEVQPDIPMSQRHAIEYLTDHFSGLCEKLKESPYFTSTFAYMIATAVLGIIARRKRKHTPEDGEEIYICGVEMLNGEEYAYQRSNAEFLVGYALGHGIQVHIPSRSALLESDGMYGYANAASLELLSRMRAYYEDRKKFQLNKRNEAALRRDQAKADWNTHDGCMQAMDWAISHLTYLCRGGKV